MPGARSINNVTIARAPGDGDAWSVGASPDTGRAPRGVVRLRGRRLAPERAGPASADSGADVVKIRRRQGVWFTRVGPHWRCQGGRRLDGARRHWHCLQRSA